MLKLLDIVSWIILTIGGIFACISSFGVLRMPNFYTRMHVSCINDSIVPMLIITGIIFQSGLNLASVKLLFIVFFMLLTGPTSSSAIAIAIADSNSVSKY